MHEEVGYRKHLNTYKGPRGNWRDYPSASVGAEIEDKSAIGHHRSYSAAADFHPLILQELTSRLGSLNGDSVNYPACKNKVGHCAENYAASGVIRAIDPAGHKRNTDLLGNLKFTLAFRPRTWEKIDWCANCHTMFD